MLKRLLVLVMLFSLILVPSALAADVAVTVDGQQVVFPDQQPVVDENNRVLVPIRYVMEKMNVEVVWEPLTNQAILSNGSTIAVFTIGSSSYSVDGMMSSMDTAPIALNNRTLFPVRYAVEAFQGTVEWEASTSTVVVKSAGPVPDELPEASDYPLAINGLLPGQSLDDAIALWGEPDSETEDPERSDIVICRFGSVYCDVFQGSQVVAIRTENSNDSTGLGIHPGSLVPDLWAVYGEPYPDPAEQWDQDASAYRHHYGYINATDTVPTQLAVGTGYYHITFWCRGTPNDVIRIESSYGYR